MVLRPTDPLTKRAVIDFSALNIDILFFQLVFCENNLFN
jgi:hypothetical protein